MSRHGLGSLDGFALPRSAMAVAICHEALQSFALPPAPFISLFILLCRDICRDIGNVRRICHP